MYKLLAIDLDDTLLRDDVTIHPDVFKAIEELKERVEVVISTGRMYRSAVQYAEELQLNGPVISYNGALVKRAGDGKVLEEHFLQMQLAEEILEFGRIKGIYANIYIDDRLYYLGNAKLGEYYSKISRVSITPLTEEISGFEKPPTKLLFIDFDPEIIKNLEIELKARYGGETAITRSKPIFLEVVPPGISKGRALRNLVKSLSISREEVVAIGDSPNDRDMIQWAGLGVAMANAYEEIKEVADYVTRATNNEGGVKEVIDRFF